MDGNGFSGVLIGQAGLSAPLTASAQATRSLEVGRKFAILLTLALGLPALFLHAHPYYGVYHDAVLYALQAFKRLEPEALGGDLFFRYGSQDSFTLFSPLYAEAIRWLGLDSAAHLIARLAVVALCVFAWRLARRLMDHELAWLALALFVVIPGRYGARDVFSYGEDFATPRAIAEALAMASLVLVVDGRRLAALIVTGVGFLMHPLMALPGLLVGIVLISQHRTRVALGIAGVAATAMVVLIANFAATGPLQFVDAEWRGMLRQGVSYVLTDRWWLVDWQRCLVPLLTLACALFSLPSGMSRRLASAALLVGGSGLALAVLADSLAPVALLIQGQPWRWIWLSRAVATLLLAPLAATLWRRGAGGRGALLLLALAWIGSEEALGLPAALLAVLAVLFDRQGGGRARAAVWIAWLSVAPLGWGIARLTSETPLAVLTCGTAAVWALVFRSRSSALRAIAILGVATFLAIQVTVDLARDRVEGFDADTYRAFAPWRERIRPSQSVLFARNPSFVWLVLRRQNYMSFGGLVFSRETALAARERLARVGFYSGHSDWIPDPRHRQQVREPLLTLTAFRRLCRVPDLDFVVTDDSLPVPTLTSNVPGPYDGLHLYACADAGRDQPR